MLPMHAHFILHTFLANVNSRSRSLYAVARSSSVACNVRALYSAGRNFSQCFYAIWYLGYPLTCTKNFTFTEIVPGEPLRRRVKHKRVVKYSILDLSKAIFRKRSKMGGKLVLISYRQSYMSFRLVSKSVALNDLERRNGRFFALFQRLR